MEYLQNARNLDVPFSKKKIAHDKYLYQIIDHYVAMNRARWAYKKAQEMANIKYIQLQAIRNRSKASFEDVMGVQTEQSGV